MSGQNKPSAAPPGPPEGQHPELDTRSIPPPEPIPLVRKEGGAAVAAAAGRIERMRKPLTAQERFSRMLTRYVGGTGSLQNKISEKGLKDYFGVEIKFGLDKKDMEAAVAAVRQKQVELNKKLKAKNKQPILVDGILGPQTFGAIKKIEGDAAVALLKEGKKEEKAVAAATPAPGAPPPAPEKAPEAPPKIAKLPPFPKPQSDLPQFHMEKFFQVKNLPPAEIKEFNIKNGDVVYVSSNTGNAWQVEKDDGTKVPIHKRYLDKLDGDDEEVNEYIAKRFEQLVPKIDYLKALDIKRDNIREYDGGIVCIAGRSGAGAADIVSENGDVKKGVDVADLDTDVSEDDKNTYIWKRCQAAWQRHGAELAIHDATEQTKVNVLTAADESQLVDSQKQELTAGKGKYGQAGAYILLSADAPLVSISSKTGRPMLTAVKEKKGQTVAILGETSGGRYYQIATERGVVAYIEKNKTDSKTLASKPKTKEAATARLA